MYSYMIPTYQIPQCYLYPTFFVFSTPDTVNNKENISSPITHFPSTQDQFQSTDPKDHKIYKEERWTNRQLKPKQENNIQEIQKDQQSSKIDSDIPILSNRSILPNIVNVILSFVRRPNKSHKVVQRIFQRMCCSDIKQQCKRFYAYQTYMKNNTNDYISRRAIHSLMNFRKQDCLLFSIEEQERYSTVFRILVRYYIHNNYLQYLTGSRKMNPSKRTDNLKVFRYLSKVVSGQDQQASVIL